jgi:hypothetical protein
MRWTLLVRQTNAPTSGRRSRVVLTPRRWRQIVDNAAHCDDDGDNKPGSPGRARRKPLKPFARGMPERFRRTCGDYCVFSFHASCGCERCARHSLRPLFREAHCFGSLGGDLLRGNVEARHCEERTRRSNPDHSPRQMLDCFASLAMTRATSHPIQPSNWNQR